MAASIRARFPGAANAGQSDSDLLRVVQSRPHGDPQRDRACEELIARYEGLVSSSVHRYQCPVELAEELTQVGYLGLMKAISAFDPAVGTSLAAYALPCVSGEIKRYFRDKRWDVRVRRPVQERWLEIRKATWQLTQQLGRDPLDAEIAGYLHLTEQEFGEAQQAAQAFQADSLDAPLPGSRDDGSALTDVLGTEDPDLERAVDMQALWTHWAELPDREQQLLMMRFYGNMTQSQIGEQLGISQMHVSRLLTRALTHLRDRLTDRGEASRRASPAPA